MSGLKCQFCGQPAEWSCIRPVEKYIRVSVARLRVGDRVCRITEWQPKPGAHGEVIEIREIVRLGLVEVTLAIHRNNEVTRTKSFRALPSAEIRSARPIACGAMICEICAQNPNDNHQRYCPDHWIRAEHLSLHET